MKLFARVGLAAATVAMATGLAVSKPEESGGQLNLTAMTTSMSVGGQTYGTRSLTGNYTSPKKAPAGASASMTIPAGLGPASPVPWTIQNLEGTGGKGSGEVVHYWGCGTAIPKGQPEVIKGSWDTTGQKWTGGSSGVTDAMKLMGITEASKVPGTYDIKISYLGNVTIDMGESQQFLDPLALLEPADPTAVNTAGAITVSWKPVPRAAGYYLMATGKDAKGRTVYWESSKGASAAWYTMGVAKAVQAGKLHGPDKTTCTIPAGIFKGQVMLMVNGFSPEVKGKGSLPAWGWAQTMTSAQLGTP